MPNFYLPYQFIPSKACSDEKKTKYQDIIEQKNHIRHDRWMPEHHSGRIICSLTLHTPTLVGNKHLQTENQIETTVENYQRNGQPAIPANSLRGMVANIAETLSLSSLRVLQKSSYSVRHEMRDSLAAIGMLKITGEGDKQVVSLQPLTLPTMKKVNENWKNLYKYADRQDLSYKLPGYIFDYSKNDYAPYADLSAIPECFKQGGEYYYAHFTDRVTANINSRTFPAARKVEKLIDESEYKKLNKSEQAGYIKGVLRVLGIDGRRSEIPEEKTHEMFIPMPVYDKKLTPISVPTKTSDAFEQMLKERGQASKNQDVRLPFFPKGYDYDLDEPLCDGQLVYFDIAEDEAGKTYVSEISFSAIWRKHLGSNTHDFFQQIDNDLLPWNKERDHLTPAECLFGVVESEKRDMDHSARALASRLRFHDGQSIKPINPLPEVRLKILSSPKLPCPSMYFHPRGQRGIYIPKKALRPTEHHPNGRKVYLHHPPVDANHNSYIKGDDQHLKQKMLCRPLPAESTFLFHIDFDNLSDAELSLLLHSLHPDDNFQHRLGLGKSLGLGSVSVDIQGVFCIDRKARYGLDALSQSRYQKIYAKKTEAEIWENAYPLEAKQLKKQSFQLKLQKLRKNDNLIDQDTLAILQTVGNPSKLQSNTPVCQPLTQKQYRDQQGSLEYAETYAWFVKNDDTKNNETGKKALPEIIAGQALPTLEQN